MRLLGLLFSAICLAQAAFAATRQPNVLFILADDLSWSDTTLNGTTKFYQTPNVERLSKRGLTFTRAYSASPLCSPTRSAILTGLSPARTGITTPNCHTPEVVLENTTGKKALIEKHRARVNPTDPQRSPTYAAMIESMDDAIGTLLDTLDRLRIADNTIIIFTSDNGGNRRTVPRKAATLSGPVPASGMPRKRPDMANVGTEWVTNHSTVLEPTSRVFAKRLIPGMASPSSPS